MNLKVSNNFVFYLIRAAAVSELLKQAAKTKQCIIHHQEFSLFHIPLANCWLFVSPAEKDTESMQFFLDVIEQVNMGITQLDLVANIQMRNSQLIRQNELLELAKNEAQFFAKNEHFLAVSSHELRGPIHSIQNAADLLSELSIINENEDSKECLSIIKKEIVQTDLILNSLLDWTKSTSNYTCINITTFDLRQTIKETIESMRINVRRPLNVTVYPDNPSLFWRKGDSFKLAQLLTPIIANAVKFSEDKSPIEILLTFQGDEVTITVADYGIGIEPEYRKAIFDPFFQVQQGFTRGFGGTGLGLAISKSLTELMKGQLVCTGNFSFFVTFF